jgi:hypothetical protein
MHLTHSEKRQINRRILWDVLHNGRGRAGTVFRLTLVVLILVSSALVPLEFLSRDASSHDIIAVLEAIVIGLFTVEYFLRVYAAPKRMKYIFSFFGIVDLLSILPFYAGLFGSPFIRLIRLIRLLKLGEVDAAAEMAEHADMRKGIGLVEGEKVEYVVTKSPVALILGLITPLLSLTFGLGILLLGEGVAAIAAGVTLILFAIVFVWKSWLDFSYDVIYVTNFRLIFQNQHLLGRSVNQVSYNAITNVKPYYPNPLSYLLRYGSLVIDTAAEHPGQIQLHTVRRHEQAGHFIMGKTVAAQHSSSGVTAPTPLVNTAEDPHVPPAE